MIVYLHYFFSILLIISAALIFFTKNPVFSVLFLILCFIFSAVILILFEIEFLGLLFIMVYVGAVAVLFLFVIMMVDTKSIRKKLIAKEFSKGFFLLFFIISLLFFFSILFFVNKSFFNIDNQNTLFNTLFIMDPTYKFSNIELIGQVLFNYYSINVLIAGFVLLIALIGSICLTLDFKLKRNSNMEKASSRNLHLINIFFK